MLITFIISGAFHMITLFCHFLGLALEHIAFVLVGGLIVPVTLKHRAHCSCVVCTASTCVYAHADVGGVRTVVI